MKVTFFSNFLTHHQTPFCENMFRKLNNDFVFVSTTPIFQERLNLGFKDLDNSYDFVLKAYESAENYKKALELSINSDIVIIGAAPNEFVEERLKQDRLTFRYAERVFLFGYDGKNDEEKNADVYEKHLKYKNNINYYVLCASAYGAEDFKKIGAYKDKMFRWGYFPETRYYNIDRVLEDKEFNDTINILWAGRFIDWKHPEIVLKIAEMLRDEQQYRFKITMLGNGIMEEPIRDQIKQKQLSHLIEVKGAVPFDKVRGYMETSNILLFTSDRNEGWGAILNEAMNSGCIAIANKDIGAVPFLIEDTQNGFVYNDGDFTTLYSRTKQVMENIALRYNMGKLAYNTIANEWNAAVATDNFLNLSKKLLSGKKDFLKEGIASKI